MSLADAAPAIVGADVEGGPDAASDPADAPVPPCPDRGLLRGLLLCTLAAGEAERRLVGAQFDLWWQANQAA